VHIKHNATRKFYEQNIKEAGIAGTPHPPSSPAPAASPLTRSPTEQPSKRCAPLPSAVPQHSAPALATTGPYAAAHGIRCLPERRGGQGRGRRAAPPRRGWDSNSDNTRGAGRVAGSSAGSSSRSRVRRSRREARRGSGGGERCRRGEEISFVCSWLVAVI
jgi:hypothetical protein